MSQPAFIQALCPNFEWEVWVIQAMEREKIAADEETRHAARWYLKNSFWAKLVQVIIL